MPSGFDIIEGRTKVTEINREIVENFVDKIIVHEVGVRLSGSLLTKEIMKR